MVHADNTHVETASNDDLYDINVDYPTGINAFNILALKTLVALKDDGGDVQDLNLEATRHINMKCSPDKLIDIKGDVVLDSNLVLGGTTYMEDMNIYREYSNPTEADYTISYGFHINDKNVLELYKYDSRANNSTVVMSFGSGKISPVSKTCTENSTFKITNILKKKNGILDIYKNERTPIVT